MPAQISSLEGGILDKVVSAGEAASAIDKIAAIPGMVWEFSGVLTATEDDSNAVRDVIYNAIKKQHPSAKVSHINRPVRRGTRIDYAIEYEKASGSEFIKDGIGSAHAYLYNPELGLYTPSRHPLDERTNIVLPSLAGILKLSGRDYSMRVSRVEFELRNEPIPQLVDQMLEQIVELLK